MIFSGLKFRSDIEGNHLSTNVRADRVTQLVIIDPSVEDHTQLIAGLVADAAVIVLNPDADGIFQLDRAIHQFQNLNALHIVSHGSPGRLDLGSVRLDLAGIDRYRAQLKSWANALSTDAQILLYGCCVGKGDRGSAFIQKLGALTGASVAASTTPTGCRAKGGDWNLDVKTALFTPVLAFYPASLENYGFTLMADEIEAFAGIAPVDPIVAGQVGAVEVTITLNSGIQHSNYGTGSFQVKNIGNKRIAAVYFDVTDALFPDTVFDPVGLAGDTLFRGFTLKNGNTGGTGVFVPGSADVLMPFYGIGGTSGYEGMRLTFDPNINQGFNFNEQISFGVDMDANSIVGLPKVVKDINGSQPLLDSWDIGGVSGAELINSKVHVLFTDGTTAVGELMGDGSQGGSRTIASQASPNKQVALTVNGLAAGGSGSYTQSNIQVLVSGQAGDTARIVLAKGFIQPFPYIDPNGNPINLSEKFVGSPFPANNAIQFQTVDVLLDGTQQDITSLFNFGAPGGTLTFPGDDKLPIGLVASIIDGNQKPLGPVSEPIYLIHANAGDPNTNTAPTTSGIANVTVAAGAANTVINLFDAFADAQTPDTGLTYTIAGNTNPALFDAITIDPATGVLTLDYTAAGTGNSNITVRATDPAGLFAETTFGVTVNAPGNTAPTTSGIANVTVAAGAANTVINLFDAFADAQTPDTGLTYTIAGNTNPALFDAIAINPATGALTLDYTAAGTGNSNITVRATDPAGLFAETTFGVTVNGVVPPGGNIRIEAESYTKGANGVAYLDKTAGNIGGAPGFTDDVDVFVNPAGGFYVGDNNKAEYLNYAFTVPSAGIYDLVVRAATNLTGKSLQVVIAGQTYSVAIPKTNGWTAWQDIVIPNVTLNAGPQTMRVNMTSSGFNLDYFELRPQGGIANTAPTTSGIANVTVAAGAANTVINLFDAFADAQTPDTGLTYTIAGNTNPALFDAITIDPATGVLTLDYTAAGTGNSNITVRATDPAGLFAETTFGVTVNAPGNTAPTTSGIANVTVAAGAANTVINLFDAFADAQTPDTGLTYTIAGNTNPALFDAIAINPATGALTLDYTAAGTGNSNITVRATDPAGLFAETTFGVTVNGVVPPGGNIRIEAESYTKGANGVAYLDKTAGNIGGAPGFTDDVDVFVNPAGGFYVGDNNKAEYLNYAFTVPSAGIYDLVVRAATNLTGKSLQVVIAGQTYSVAIPKTNGWTAWQDIVIPNVTLNAGPQTMRVNMTSSGFNLDYFELVSKEDLTAPTASLATSGLSTLNVGSTQGARFTVTYSDNIAIDASSLDPVDVRVTRVGGQPIGVTLVGINPPSGNGTPLQVTYEIAAPAGGWTLADRGNYTIEVRGDEVFDTWIVPNSVAAQELGSLFLNVVDPLENPSTIGIPDVAIAAGSDDTQINLGLSFADLQDPDSALTYTVLNITNPSLVTATVNGGNLVLDAPSEEEGVADITVRATDTDGFFIDATLTVSVVNPLPADDAIRINSGGNSVLDASGKLWLADTYFTGGSAFTTGSGIPIDNTLTDTIYQTQRKGNSFSYAIPVANGNYNIDFHLSELEYSDFEQRSFDVSVEGALIFDNFDVYGEIKNAFLEGENTAKVIQGPDKTTITASVNDGILNIDFNSVLNDAVIAGLAIKPVSGAEVLLGITGNATQVAEAGAGDSYTLVLNSQPTSNVTIALQNSPANQISTGVTSLTFTPANWNIPQVVNVSAVDDANSEGVHLATINHTVTSADPSYNGLAIDPLTVTISDNESVPIAFSQKVITDPSLIAPTVGTWGPDGRLYVGTIEGEIKAITFDDNYNVVNTQVITTLSGLYNNDILGIAFNPFEFGPGQQPKIYVAHSALYYDTGAAKNNELLTTFFPYSGQVSVLEGPNFDVHTPLVTGIGVSNHDHGVNGLDFDDEGNLLIAVGGNTNAGITATKIGGLSESPTTAAILKAEITKPNFNGAIEYELSPDAPVISGLTFDPATSQSYGQWASMKPGTDVSIYASGLRNPFDITWSTKGQLYATDNGPNVNFGDVSTGANTEIPFTQNVPDEINLIEEGNYYGHPNRNRGRTDDRQNVYRSAFTASIPGEYTAPLAVVNSATVGITEYRSLAFNGQLYGNLFAQKWKQQVWNVKLDSSGDQSLQVTSITGMADGLDILTGPGGAVVGIDYTADYITVATPDPLLNPTGATAWDIHPWRAPAGTEFVIGGVNFNPTNTTVTIADQAITITGISSNRIRGILPDLSGLDQATLSGILGPDGLADVVVQSGGQVSTIPDAFKPLFA
ncbi:DUF4347 domain-containing protein [Altericista sp. CCNU0014]|uniref:DUF4347 domain-containing protein n=1 Tax=Altericista sp. CCNU0014 TaxID=3082949 RepID=UPI003850D284